MPVERRGPVLPPPQVSAANGSLEVQTSGNATVEVVNLSVQPTTFGRLEDSMEVGRADPAGYFGARVAQAGDQLRVRTKTADGVSPWVNVRVGGGPDLRAAFVNLARLRAESGPDGLEIRHHTRLPATEPFATVRFTHEPTGVFVDVVATETGALPPVRLPGYAGDRIGVAVSDGAGNLDFSVLAGHLWAREPLRNPDEPPPLNRDRGARLSRVLDQLFVDGPDPQDVRQGNIGNCYVPAALAAVAYAEPGAITEMIQDRGEGRFTVRFWDDAGGLVGGPIFIDTDADFYFRGTELLYGKQKGHRPGDMGAEIWFSLIEKAYAQWKGGYENIAQGGSVGALMAAVLGRPNRELWSNQNTPDMLWEAVQRGLAENRAMAGGTFGTVESALYRGSGLYANHAYSVLGAVEENGQRFLRLRNPWGNGEPGRDGQDDGIFLLKLEDFNRYFQVLNIC